MAVYVCIDLPGVTEQQYVDAFRAFVRDADLAGCWRQVGVELPELRCFPVRHLER